MQAIRKALENVERADGSHPGLILQRYLKSQKSEEKATDNENTEWDLLFDHVIKAQTEARKVYDIAFERWEKSFSGMEDATALRGGVFSTRGRLVCGLGNASPTETGVTLHHTYGVPVIPGSSLKGLAAHYCHEVLGVIDGTFRGPETEKDGCKESGSGDAFASIFGTTEDAGHVTFHDALIFPGSLVENKSGLLRDIMTPHHSDYYGDSGGKGAPTDFDSPTPVSFLSVKGDFLVVLTCDDSSEKGKAWLDLAMRILKDALDKEGIGGKTTSGYGRMKKMKDWNPPEPKKPDPYAVGNVIEVVRVKTKNKKKKDRMEFEAQDGTTCFFGRSVDVSSLSDISIGTSIQVKIRCVEPSPRRYILGLPDIQS